MAVDVVTLEIECHDEDNAFHTTYKVQKYLEYKAKLSTAFKRKLSDEGIHRVQVNCNQGPPKGYDPIESVKNWYVHRRKDATAPPKRVRYPRLGSFEVTLRCPSDLGCCPGMCSRLQVWSKLTSKKWPDVERLAADLARLVSDASQDEDVSDQVRRFQDAMKPPEVDADISAVDCMRLSVNKSRLTGNSPMFFSMTPRTREPTPVSIRTPSIKSSQRCQNSMSAERSLPQRPTSASTPSRAQRPNSAVRKRPQTASATLSSSNQTTWGAQEAPSLVQLTSSPSSQGHEGKMEETLLPAEDTAEQILPDPWAQHDRNAPRINERSAAVGSATGPATTAAPSEAVLAAAIGQHEGYQAPTAVDRSPALVVAPAPTPVPAPAKLPSLAAAPPAPAVASAPAAPVAPLQRMVQDDYDESFEDDSPTAAHAPLSSHPSAVSLEAEQAREVETRRRDNSDAERLEAERREADRHEAERRENDRREGERREAERRESERLEAERLEIERLEAERQETKRLEAERRETERREAERRELNERLESERRRAEDQQRIDAKRRQDEEQKKKEAEREEQQRLEVLRRKEAEAQRLEAEKARQKVAAPPAPEVDDDDGYDDSFEDDVEPPAPAKPHATNSSPPELAKAPSKPANDTARSAGASPSPDNQVQVSDDDIMDEELYEDDDDFESDPRNIPPKPAEKIALKLENEPTKLPTTHSSSMEAQKAELAKVPSKPADDSARSAGTRASSTLDNKDQLSDDDIGEDVYEDDDFEEDPGDIDMTTSKVPAKPAPKLVERVLADGDEYDYVEDNEIEDDISEGSHMDDFEDDNISIQSGD